MGEDGVGGEHVIFIKFNNKKSVSIFFKLQNFYFAVTCCGHPIKGMHDLTKLA